LLTRNTLNKTDLITVRDNESKLLLDQIGVKKEVFVTSDLAFLYEPAEAKIDPVFNFPYNILQLKGHENIDVEEVADIARFMHYKTQRETVLVPFFKEIDEEICRAISEKTKFPVFVPKDIDEVFTLFKGAEAIVSMRYHALLFAIVLGKPVLPIVYDKKVKNLATLFVTDSLNITDLKLSHFAPEFTKLLEKPSQIDELKDKLKIEKENAKETSTSFFSTYLKQFFLELLAPAHCVICEKKLYNSEFICEDCFDRIEFNEYPLIFHEEMIYYYGITKYKGVMEEVIKKFKFQNYKVLSEKLGDMVIDFTKRQNIQFDIIGFIPMTKKSFLKEGTTKHFL